MSPALGRRTPQQPLTEGRPKRQAVLNRKETLDLTKGNAKKESTVKKETLKEKESPTPKKADESKAAEDEEKAASSKTTKKATKNNNKSKPAIKQGKRKSLRNQSKADKDVKTEDDETEKEEDNSTETKEEKKDAEDIQDDESDAGNVSDPPDDGEITDDDDSDFDPDDDPDKLWCFCKKPHGNRFMICCDTCEEWFHGDCVGITMTKGREMEKTGEEWCCRKCKEKAVKKAAASKSALNSPLKKTSGKTQLDAATLSKARSVSLDSMKNNLGKKIKDKSLTLSTSSVSSVATAKDENTAENPSVDESGTKDDQAPPTSSENKLAKSREKRKDSIDKNSFSNLLTFDQVPMKREEKTTPRKGSTDRREPNEEVEKKRKDSQSKVKVRTTPTPKNTESVKCLRVECTKPIMKGSIYCSRECIYKYANDSIKYLENERKKTQPAESKTTAKGTTVISPAHSTTESAPMETTQERIAVFDKSTGKVVAGVMAPTKKYLFAWLEEHPTYEVLKSNKQTDVKNPKKNQDEVVRSNVRKSLREVLTSRCKESQMPINIEAIGKLCKRIEYELLKTFSGETAQKYKTKYRSLIFNLKDTNNKILYKRVISGEINPTKLVNMTPEQLATPELARWREHESKHGIEMIKKRELEEAEMKKFSGVKKTHKGEVEIDGQNENYETLQAKIEPVKETRKPSSVSEASTSMVDLLKDTTEEHSHHLFDSNCKICTGKLPPPGESQITGVSTTIIQAVPESSVPSPQMEDEVLSLSSPPSPDTPVSLTSTSPRSPKSVAPPSARKQASVWRGFVMMQKVAKFVCTAYAVSGSCENLMEILPDTIHICGRIPPNQVWEYLGQLKEGRKESRQYIDVIRFEMSSGEEKSGYIKLYTYFYTRKRIGVVGNCYSGVKDMYIVPLSSHDPIPAELKPLPGLPRPRPHMLIGIIVRVKKQPKKLTEIPSGIDSSPESLAPKKKKKKKKEKEKIEIEAQKKLIDIIFKNRTADLASIVTVDGAQTSSTSSDLDPVSLLKSITNTTAAPDNSASNKEIEQRSTDQASTMADDAPETSPGEVDIKSEEEQLKLLREQQEEIDSLKAKIQSNIEDSTLPVSGASVVGNTTDNSKSGDITTPTKTQEDETDVPYPTDMEEALQETSITVAKDDVENKDVSTVPMETSTQPILESPNDGEYVDDASIDATLSPPTEVTALVAESENIYDAEQIMREALHRTEQDEANLQAENEANIPLLGSDTHKPLPSTLNSITISSTIPSTSRTTDAAGDVQPSDDDYVMNLIENIELPNVVSEQSPLDALKDRSEVKKMPGLPNINLPSTSSLLLPGIPLPLPGVIPKVPIPPNIKLPPGVPFPPLPPPIPTSETADVSITSRENLSSQDWNTSNEYRESGQTGYDDRRSDPRNVFGNERENFDSRNNINNRLDPRNSNNDIRLDPRNNNNRLDSRHRTLDQNNFQPDPMARPPRRDSSDFQERRSKYDSRDVDLRNPRDARNLGNVKDSRNPEVFQRDPEGFPRDPKRRFSASPPPGHLEEEPRSLSWRDYERRRKNPQVIVDTQEDRFDSHQEHHPQRPVLPPFREKQFEGPRPLMNIERNFGHDNNISATRQNNDTIFRDGQSLPDMNLCPPNDFQDNPNMHFPHEGGRNPPNTPWPRDVQPRAVGPGRGDIPRHPVPPPRHPGPPRLRFPNPHGENMVPRGSSQNRFPHPRNDFNSEMGAKILPRHQNPEPLFPRDSRGGGVRSRFNANDQQPSRFHPRPEERDMLQHPLGEFLPGRDHPEEFPDPPYRPGYGNAPIPPQRPPEGNMSPGLPGQLVPNAQHDHRFPHPPRQRFSGSNSLPLKSGHNMRMNNPGSVDIDSSFDESNVKNQPDQRHWDRKPWEFSNKGNKDDRYGRHDNREWKGNQDKPHFDDRAPPFRQSQQYRKNPSRDHPPPSHERHDRKRRYSDTASPNKGWRRNEDHNMPPSSKEMKPPIDTSVAHGAKFQRTELEDGELT